MPSVSTDRNFHPPNKANAASAYLLDFRTGRSFGEPQELQGSLSIGFFMSGALSEAAFEKLIAEQLSERTAQ